MSEATAFEGRRAFQDSVVSLLAWAADHQARCIAAFDPDFSDWPWSQPGALTALQAGAARGRRLRLLALRFERLQQSQPRFVSWRRDYGHLVEARAIPVEEPEPELPVALLLIDAGEAGVRGLRLLERSRWRGTVFADQATFSQNWHWFDAVSQRSPEAFPCTTLGL
jgi:hypothetical protein